MTDCPLCGHEFSQGAKSSCSACPMSGGCVNFTCCPHCGYKFVTESKTLNLIKRIFAKKEPVI